MGIGFPGGISTLLATCRWMLRFCFFNSFWSGKKKAVRLAAESKWLTNHYAFSRASRQNAPLLERAAWFGRSLDKAGLLARSRCGVRSASRKRLPAFSSRTVSENFERRSRGKSVKSLLRVRHSSWSGEESEGNGQERQKLLHGDLR
jgi:hypothetical protein